MIKRQFSFLVIATLLLSPTFVSANESGESTNLSVGNIRLQTSSDGSVNIQTPKININTASLDRQVLISRRRRVVTPAIRRGRIITTPTIIRTPRIDSQGRIITTPTIIRTPKIDSQGRIITTPTIIRQSRIENEDRGIDPQNSSSRSTTIRSSGNGSESTSEQHHSVSCSSGSSSSSQSTQTINGRTVTSEAHCP